MRAVDTSVLVRLLIRDDADQVMRAEAFVEAGAWVSHLVLAEAVWVLGSAYGMDRGRIGTLVEMLLAHGRLVIQDPDVVRAALDDFRARRSIGFADCLIVRIARKAGHRPTGTLDRAMSRLPDAIAL
ncbi:MAG: type II toxin-antitoxin system VapC family toxin [Gammaproteobacteria bacterium]|nr:type II toxin-antitoxin system VapC family toxin [Gammaproteobacteria bacterium]